MEWRVNTPDHNKEFKYLNDARKYKKEIEAGLPDDAEVFIEQKEEAANLDGNTTKYMWVPYE